MLLYEPEIHLGENVVVPNNAGWRLIRMPALPETPFFTLAPDWVCEVLSPATRDLDLDGKRAVYARAGIDHMWLVDPEAKSLEAFELRDGNWVLLDSIFDDVPVSLPPFEAVSFNLGDLWKIAPRNNTRTS